MGWMGKPGESSKLEWKKKLAGWLVGVDGDVKCREVTHFLIFYNQILTSLPIIKYIKIVSCLHLVFFGFLKESHHFDEQFSKGLMSNQLLLFAKN